MQRDCTLVEILLLFAVSSALVGRVGKKEPALAVLILQLLSPCLTSFALEGSGTWPAAWIYSGHVPNGFSPHPMFHHSAFLAHPIFHGT